MSKSAQEPRLLHPDSKWTICLECGEVLNVRVSKEGDDRFLYPYEAEERTVEGDLWPGAQPGETYIQYRLRMHLAAHAKHRQSPLRRRKGRPSEVESKGRYAYALYATPDPKDRRRRVPSTVMLWKEGEELEPVPLPGLVEIERGSIPSAGYGALVILRKQRKLQQGREYVRRHRAKKSSARS